MRAGPFRHLSLLLLSVGPVALAACSTPPIATFTMASGPSRLIPLAEDEPVLTTRLRVLGDARAKVVVQAKAVVIQGGGPLPAPEAFFAETGTFTLRPVYCGAPAYSPPSGGSGVAPNGALPSCAGAYSLSADNLDVNADTGQPTNAIPPSPAFADYPSTTAADADVPSTTVLLPTAPSSGSSYPRYVLGPAQVTSSDIESARAKSVYQSWIVAITLTQAGAIAWNQLAQEAFHSYVGVDLDGVVISAPITEPSTTTFAPFGNQFQLSGNFTKTSALQLAALLSSGSLPVPLVPSG